MRTLAWQGSLQRSPSNGSQIRRAALATTLILGSLGKASRRPCVALATILRQPSLASPAAVDKLSCGLLDRSAYLNSLPIAPPWHEKPSAVRPTRTRRARRARRAPLGATLCPPTASGSCSSAYTSREQTRRPQRRKAANPGEISGDRGGLSPSPGDLGCADRSARQSPRTTGSPSGSRSAGRCRGRRRRRSAVRFLHSRRGC